MALSRESFGNGDVESKLSQKKLPHSLEAEQSALGALLVDCTAAAGVFQLLTADDFYSPRNAKLYSIFQSLYDQHSTVDEVMAFAEMERLGVAESLGGMDTLANLIEKVPAAANAEYYARIIHEKAILRS